MFAIQQSESTVNNTGFGYQLVPYECVLIAAALNSGQSESLGLLPGVQSE